MALSVRGFVAAAILVVLTVVAGGSVRAPEAVAEDIGGRDAVAKGPQVGDSVPHPLVALDQMAQQRTFDSLKGERGLILLFNRSVDWCPYCQNQVIEWNAAQARANALGYNVAELSYDEIDKITQFANRHSITLPLLSDPDSEIIRGFDILNETQKPGTFGYGIPYPIIFVINPKQVITHRFSEESYKDRPAVDVVLGALAPR